VVLVRQGPTNYRQVTRANATGFAGDAEMSIDFDPSIRPTTSAISVPAERAGGKVVYERAPGASAPSAVRGRHGDAGVVRTDVVTGAAFPSETSARTGTRTRV
jgi:hypothetical protein